MDTVLMLMNHYLEINSTVIRGFNEKLMKLVALI
ncbi:hypothetical protein SAMN05192574_11012 [Mucilaginibacter gossypiicola]|uniref:Uncharacterized protein n=1 Tax=Mucilaginibacter gossypiicola TaxID=551995 RepID=A0A1H8R6K9_9SPHI|nr:hypothetical protein SAMN05192574_11012 [Mucilaginibacter gossypiicola]